MIIAASHLAAQSAGAALPVVGWGDNGLNQIAVPDSASNAVAIAAGGGHNLAIKADGAIAAWGFNFYGQLDTPAGIVNVRGVAAGFDHSVALSADGMVVAWGRTNFNQTVVPAGLNNVVAISANQNYSVALKADGTVAAWGASDYGQLNVPAGLNNVTAISAGGTHVLALKSDGTITGWGLNGNGQATAPPGLANVIAVAAGNAHSLALKSDGTIVAWGANDFGQTNVPAGLNNVVAISAGSAHNLALKGDGTVVAWGWNLYGQATVPAGLANVGAISAGFQHSLALIVNDPPPVIVCPGDRVLQCVSCNTDPENTGMAAATDNGPVRISYTDAVSGDCPKVITRTWVATDSGDKTASCVQTITCVPSSLVSLVTDEAGCTFDANPATPVQDFRLIFTPDMQNFPCYRLAGSNPGQFYYNVFHTGTPGEPATFNITLPFPFVTLGANPIRAYDWVTILGNGAAQCVAASNAFAVGSQQVSLASYGSPPQPWTTVAVSLTVPDSGTVFLTLRLDYGLKKLSGFTRNTADDALDCPNGASIIIANHGSYDFMVAGAQSDVATLQNVNVFKKNVGVAGLVKTRGSSEPIPGAKVSLLNARKVWLLSSIADDDGYYVLAFKHTGKEATYYLSLATPDGYKEQRAITLKANKFMQVDFLTP